MKSVCPRGKNRGDQVKQDLKRIGSELWCELGGLRSTGQQPRSRLQEKLGRRKGGLLMPEKCWFYHLTLGERMIYMTTLRSRATPREKKGKKVCLDAAAARSK